MTTHRQSCLCRVRTFHGEHNPRRYPGAVTADTLLTGTAKAGPALTTDSTPEHLGPSLWACRCGWESTQCCPEMMCVVILDSLALTQHLITPGCTCSGKNFCKAQIHAFKKQVFLKSHQQYLGGKKNSTSFPDFRKICVVEMIFFLNI